MISWKYDYFLPKEISETLTKVVEEFAKSKSGRTYDAWYHDLPVWIAREKKKDDRVNRVQIDVVIILEGRFLSFMPDAHKEGKLAEAKDIREHRLQISLDDLSGLENEAMKKKICRALNDVLKAAAKLPLTKSI